VTEVGEDSADERARISERLKALKPDGPHALAEPILEVRALGKSFGGLRAVNDFSFDVARGSITALIGPNGAGKTTAFNMCTGVIPPTDGSIRLRQPGKVELPRGVELMEGDWVELRGLRPDLICRLGVARTFQNIRLFEDQTVLDNVMVGLHRRLQGGLAGALLRGAAVRAEEEEARAASAHYLDFVGLLPRHRAAAGSLAYGERRRLEIARALAAAPRLLLLDEPAAGMNPQETVALMRLILKIREAGITVLLIEHDMKLVMEISDTIYVLDHGEEIARGAPEAVRKDPKVIHAYLGVPD
jgi:branched-chain amino acid transport system ATP-binding protein